jgi:hypothetical protein
VRHLRYLGLYLVAVVAVYAAVRGYDPRPWVAVVCALAPAVTLAPLPLTAASCLASRQRIRRGERDPRDWHRT